MLRLSLFVLGMLLLSELLQAATPDQVDPIVIYSVSPNSTQPSSGSSCEGSAQVFLNYWRMNADLNRVSVDGPTPCNANHQWTYTVTNHIWDFSTTYTKQSLPTTYCPKGYAKQVTGTFTSTCIKNTLYDGQCDGSIMCCSTRTDNPLDVVTGNKHYEVIEYASEGVVPLVMRRYYNSTLSHYWGYDFTQKLNILKRDNFGQVLSAEAVRPNGHVYQFVSHMEPDGDIGHTSVWRSLSPQQDRVMNLTPLFQSGGDLLPPLLEGWILEIQGMREYYHPDGQLDYIEYEDGNVVHVQNSHSSIFVSNLHGQSITLIKPNIPGLPYEPPTELVTPLGSVEYLYRIDHPEVLERVEYPDGTTESYHFEETAYPDLITGITDRRGIRNSYVEYKYPAIGKAESSSLALDAEKVTALSMSSSSTIPYQRIVRNSRGHDTIMSFDKIDGVAVLSEISDCRSCDFGTASFEHELTGVLESMTLDGVITEFDDYDERGNAGQIVEALGTSKQRTTTVKYDDRFFDQTDEIRIDSLRAGLGDKITTITRNDASDITSIRVTGWDIDDTPIERVVSMRYDGPLGQLSEIDGPLNNADRLDVTSLEYYPNDLAEGFNRARLRRVVAPEGIVMVEGLQYTATGKRSFMRTANGLEVSLQYEAGNDRLELMTEYDSVSGETRKTRWTYLDTGEIETITTGFESDAATTIRFGYDDARRLTRVYDGLGNFLHFQLDTEGNPESESVYDSAGVLNKHLGRVFDAYNHIEERTQMNEVRDIYVKPNGDIEQVIDSKATTRYGYDELRRLTSIIRDVDGVDPMTANATTQIEYDHHDNIEEVIDPEDAATRYKYDDLGNMRVIASPDSGTKYIEYDSAGNIEMMLDGLQQSFQYQTDALSRTISVDMPGSEHDITIDYDDCQNGVGRLCSVTNPSSSVEYSYDAWGNVLQHQSIGYRWDEANRLVSIIYPSGAEVRYGYDAASRIDSVRLVRGGVETVLASGIDYEPFGAMKNLIYGNGIQMSHQRDLAWRTELIDASHALSLDYMQYDGNGNLEMRQNSLLMESEVYSYDTLDRLGTASGLFGGIDFGYDLNGNRTSLDDGEMAVYTYEPFSNRMHTSDGVDVQVDENGNTRIRGEQSLEYTPHNRLYKVYEHGDLVAIYGYNGLGQRVSKRLEASGFETRYLYGLDGQLLAETSNDGSVLKEYIYLNGVPFAVLDNDNDGDGIPNLSDNCTDHANGPLLADAGGNNQLDTDGDGFGNRCDADFNDSGLVNALDLGILRNEFFSTDSDADLNGDGVVNGQDIGILKQLFFGAPGPANSADIEVRYIHNDHLGTPKSMTDEAGRVIWTASHAPFGTASLNPDPDADGHQVTLNIRYPGQYFDQETGLHYNYFRYYDPATGRYMTSDPIGLSGGLNSYGYVMASPLQYADPYGLVCINAITRNVISSASGGFVSGAVASRSIFGGIGGALAGGLTAYISSSRDIGDYGVVALGGTVGLILGGTRSSFIGGAASASLGLAANDQPGRNAISGAFGGFIGGAFAQVQRFRGARTFAGRALLGGRAGFLGGLAQDLIGGILSEISDCGNEEEEQGQGVCAY